MASSPTVWAPQWPSPYGFATCWYTGYAEVDDRRVVAYLGHLADVAGFVRHLTGLIQD